MIENLAAGATTAELHEQCSTVPAALAYAADLARNRIVPVPFRHLNPLKIDENLSETDIL